MHSGAPSAHGHHIVTFYVSDPRLFETVGDFVRDGIAGGEPTLLIATETHAIGILDNLRARQIDVDGAVARRDISVIDALDTLEQITVDGEIDPQRFASALAAGIDAAAGGRPASTTVRVFGEMVDVLCQAGKHDEAIRLELLGDRLVAERDVLVLCAYASSDFIDQPTTYEAVCCLHSHVTA